MTESPSIQVIFYNNNIHNNVFNTILLKIDTVVESLLMNNVWKLSGVGKGTCIFIMPIL